MFETANGAAEAGDLETAIRCFRACDDARGDEGLAQCLMEAGDDAGAVEAARRSVARSPEWAVAWMTLGRASLNSRNFADALHCFERCVALDPGLASEVDADADQARGLTLKADEREFVIAGTTLRISQLRDTRIWECGVVLAKFLEGRDLCGTRAVELGAGTGLVGLAAAALGATVLCTDRDVRALQLNVEASDLAVHVDTFDWTRPPPASLASSTFELVLAADVVYNATAVEPFVHALDLVLGGRCLLAHKRRHPHVDDLFFDALRRRFDVDCLVDRHPICILSIRRKS